MTSKSTDALDAIPFNKPFIAGNELLYISQAVSNGQLAGDGAFTRKCHSWLEERLNVRRALLTHSCTGALEMAAILTNVGPGDEFIVPSFTFVSTANAFVLRGAIPRFVDIRPDTLNIDEIQIEAAISERTRAIVVVHYAGVPCEMDKIVQVGKKHSIPIIEDAAQGLQSAYREQYVGTFGALSCFSFHETKNYISGEGGALAINEPDLIERAEIIREKGTNRSKFFRGEIDKYTWVDIGSSYLPSELIAAFLYAQLEHADEIFAKRHNCWNRYRDALQSLESQGMVRLPVVPPHCGHNAHMFYLLLNSGKARDELLAHLRSKGIHAVFHYIPLHCSPMGETFGYRAGEFPVTEATGARLLRLPMFYDLTADMQLRVVETIRSFFS